MSRGRGCVNSTFFGGAGENGEKFLTFCEEKIADLLPKNTSTRRITTAIFRISARLNVPLYPEFCRGKDSWRREPNIDQGRFLKKGLFWMNHKTIIIIGFGFCEIWRIKQIGGGGAGGVSASFSICVSLFFWPWEFKSWLKLSFGLITIHWIVQLGSLRLICWIMSSPLDSAVQRLKNSGEMIISLLQFNSDQLDQSEIIQWYNQWIIVFGRKNG